MIQELNIFLKRHNQEVEIRVGYDVQLGEDLLKVTGIDEIQNIIFLGNTLSSGHLYFDDFADLIVVPSVPLYIAEPLCECGAESANSRLINPIPIEFVRHSDWCPKYKPLFPGGK